MENKGRKIKKSVIYEMMEQNKIMRELLEKWPAREIRMDYEKEWDEQRQAFFLKHQPVDLNIS